MSDDAPSLGLALRALAYNNLWANHRLLTACRDLDPDAFAAPRIGFFPSLQATLNHILVIDRFYVDALEGGTLGPAAWANPVPFPEIGGLQAAQREVDGRLIAICEGLGEDADRIVRVVRGEGRVQEERADRLLLHLFQHDIHHRGQAHAMLSGTKVAPPHLDEFFSVGEAPLRAAEFAELGWSEATIWASTRRREAPA